MISYTGRHTHYCLNAYRIMWLFVFFDLPTSTREYRRIYTTFRKRIQEDGFNMLQYSVYTRHCASRESLMVHVRRVQKLVPKEGQVTILQITDKQYGGMLNIIGRVREAMDPAPSQLELF
jgi:CRISPR-associated protein Cas2